jgi:hypothetical protein
MITSSVRFCCLQPGRTGKDLQSGRRFLAAAWGFFCGMAYVSFFGQLEDNRLGIADPAPISSGWVAAIKGIGFAIGVTALILSLWPIPEAGKIES